MLHMTGFVFACGYYYLLLEFSMCPCLKANLLLTEIFCPRMNVARMQICSRVQKINILYFLCILHDTAENRLCASAQQEQMSLKSFSSAVSLLSTIFLPLLGKTGFKKVKKYYKNNSLLSTPFPPLLGETFAQRF